MSVRPKPHWRTSGVAGKAHLVDDAAIELRAWCGADLQSSVEAGLEDRCNNCLKALSNFVTEAEEAPPDVVVEAVIVQARRGKNQVDLLDRLRRFLNSGSCRHLEVQLTASVTPIPLDVIVDLKDPSHFTMIKS